MAMYTKCPKGHEVEVNDMPEAACDVLSWPHGKFSQGEYREPGTPVECVECGNSFVPKDLFLKA